MNEEAKKAALRVLERRDVSHHMLKAKLSEKGFSPEEAEETADYFREIGFVDDSRFAELVVRHYSAKGYGERRIREKLKEYGIDRELWAEALEALPETDDTVYRLLRSRLQGRVLSQESLRKAEGFLLRRGYTYEEIRRALEQYKTENETEE